ncbi:MAG: phosphoribosylamine--glycine ligase [Terriglobales bacterium]
MKVLVLGGGGREHALAWKLQQSEQVDALWALPGSDGMAAAGVHCLPGDACDAPIVLAAAAAQEVDLIVVGPEAPLAAGIADHLRAAGRRVFGPSQAAARLESSKIFAKEFMARHAIPTAPFAAVDTLASAQRALRQLGPAAVLKADGLAAGKGVVVPASEAEAEAAAETLLARYGSLVIEQRLAGRELSMLAVANGQRFLTLVPARDHKRLHEGDHGPNTGGMGAIAGWGLLDQAMEQAIEHAVIEPALAGMAAEATPFQGVLYCGLMLNAQGPHVLEFNVRFGDPEAQAILPCWRGDVAALLYAAASGADLPLGTHTGLAPAGACVVAASAGYPESPERGHVIAGLDASGQVPSAQIFHAGTRRSNGLWITDGGRVLAAASPGASLERALAACYDALGKVQFRGMQMRRDIGQ